MTALNLLVIPASARQGSLNRQLACFAAGQAQAAGLVATELDLRALALPVYDGDLEASSGVPDGAQRLLDALLACDGVLVVTPEYNGFPTPLFINAFDWLSRIAAAPPRPSGLEATANKPVALLSASPGPGGALRSMNYVRQYLQMAFQMVVVPQQFALGKAQEAFDETGVMRDGRAAQSVVQTVTALAALASALKAAKAGVA